MSVIALDSDSGEPVRGAVLQLASDGGQRTVSTPASVTTPAGEVTLTAVGAPAGYRYEGTVFRSGAVEPGKISSFTFQLRRKPAGGGVIQAVARNRVSGAPIPGAAFTVKRCSGTYIDSPYTGPDGVATLRGVEPGCYRVTESSTPAGYEIDRDSHDVTVSAMSTSTVTVYDMPLHYRVVRDPARRVPVASIPTGRDH